MSTSPFGDRDSKVINAYNEFGRALARGESFEEIARVADDLGERFLATFEKDGNRAAVRQVRRLVAHAHVDAALASRRSVNGGTTRPRAHRCTAACHTCAALKIGTAHASAEHMRTMSITTAASIVLLYAVVSSRADAAPRRGIQDFCRGAPDLCVFVCPQSGSCEGLVSRGFSCEQRLGTLLVAEGSGENRVIITSYADSFAFCWWPTPGQNYSELPDPATTYVPAYNPTRDDWLCGWCWHRARHCGNRAARFSALCIHHHNRVYRLHCLETMRRFDRPYGRRGTPMRGNHECEGLLTYGPGDEASDGFGQRQDRLMRCKSELIQACVDDFRNSHPGESVANTIPLKITEIASLGLEAGFERSSVVNWGGTVGYAEACSTAMGAAVSQCAVEQSSCEVSANPENTCEGW